MDFGRLLFSSNGRIGQRDFWIGFLILFVAAILLHAALVVGTVVWFLSTYCWICLFAKRLHDMGRSGFDQVWLYILDILGVAALLIGGLGAIIAGIFSGREHMGFGLVAGGVGLILLGFLAWSVVRLAFVLWLGLSPGQVGDNRFGPEPLR